MEPRRAALAVLRLVAALGLASITWAVVGYLATAPLGAIYGWSGHPSVPAAPAAVYVGLYLVVLPLASIGGSWYVTGRVASALRRRRGAR